MTDVARPDRRSIAHEPSRRFGCIRRSPSGLVIALVMAVAPMTAHSADLISPESLAGVGLSRYWQVAIPLAPAETLVVVHQVDEYIYAITDYAVVVAIHADTGLIRWAEQVDLPGFPVYAPTHRTNAAGNRETVIVSANRVGIYTIEHGDVVTGMRLPFSPSTPGVAGIGRKISLSVPL